MTLAQQLLDSDDAVEAALRMVNEGTQVPEAAAAVFRMGLTPSALAVFAIVGLGRAVHDRLHALRAEATGEGEIALAREIDDQLGLAPRGRNQAKGVHHARAFWERALSAPYWTPEGNRPLLAFTLADVRSLLTRSEAQIAGWRKRREAMRLAERLMVQRKVDFLRALPDDDKAAIAEALR